jgi:hypothetical protein
MRASNQRSKASKASHTSSFVCFGSVYLKVISWVISQRSIVHYGGHMYIVGMNSCSMYIRTALTTIRQVLAHYPLPSYSWFPSVSSLSYLTQSQGSVSVLYIIVESIKRLRYLVHFWLEYPDTNLPKEYRVYNKSSDLRRYISNHFTETIQISVYLPGEWSKLNQLYKNWFWTVHIGLGCQLSTQTIIVRVN